VQAEYGAPQARFVLGADALRTRGRPQRVRRHGKADTPLAGSETSGRHGNMRRGTREALPLAWGCQVRSARGTGGVRP
jgi:hypothetical protein